MGASEVVAAVARYGMLLTRDETRLQEMLAQIFGQEGLDIERERQLAPGERPDFFWSGPRLAIEVKTQGGRTALLGQLARYAQLDEVDEVLVLTTKATLTALPDSLNGKPITAYLLTSLGG